MTINEPDIKPTQGKVKYSLRLALGDYEHEELSVELSNSAESYVSPEDLMKRAIGLCHKNTTRARAKAQKALNEKKKLQANEEGEKKI